MLSPQFGYLEMLLLDLNNWLTVDILRISFQKLSPLCRYSDTPPKVSPPSINSRNPNNMFLDLAGIWCK